MFSNPFLLLGREGDRQWYLYLIGIILVMIAATVGQLPLLGVLYTRATAMFPDDPDYVMDNLADSSKWQEMGMSQNLGLALMLLSFVAGCIGLYFVVKYIHKRSFKSIITPFKNIRWNRVLFGCGVWLLITSISQIVDYKLHPEDYQWQFQAGNFIWLVVICLIILPFQTSIEELFMRGYLMPPIARLVKLPIISALITGAAFGALHMSNPEVKEYGLGIMMIYYVSAGLFLGIMTIMDNGLELALGVHFATNFSAALFATYDGAALQTPALFKISEMDAQTMSLGFIGLAILFLFICHFVLKWKNWGYLFTPLDLNSNDNLHIELKDELHV